MYHQKVEPDLRGRPAQAAQALVAGTFRPALPSDSQEVVRLFAIAARAVCAQPTALEAVTTTLLSIAQQLVAPERQAALECARMWQLFARVAQLPKDTLRQEAARAFCRDLDTLGQKLDLPPLAEWPELPQGVDQVGHDVVLQGAVEPTASERASAKAEPLLLAQVQANALALVRANPKGRLDAQQAARLLAVLAAQDRQKLFQQMIGQGELGRSDVNLLIRFLLKGDEVGSQDTMLREVLEKLGAYLLR